MCCRARRPHLNLQVKKVLVTSAVKHTAFSINPEIKLARGSRLEHIAKVFSVLVSDSHLLQKDTYTIGVFTVLTCRILFMCYTCAAHQETTAAKVFVASSTDLELSQNSNQ